MSGTHDDPVFISDDDNSDIEIVYAGPRRNSDPRGGGTVMNRPIMHLAPPNPGMDYAPPVVEARMSIFCTIYVGNVLSAFSLYVFSWFF